MITQPYSLSLQPGGVPIRIPCVQGDASSRTISLSLISCGATFTPPSGAVVTFDGTKPDGKSFSVSGTISGSTVSVTLTAQMTAVAGETPCQLTIISGTEVLGTARILLCVQPSAISDDPDLSETELSAIADLRDAAITSKEEAAAAASNAAASASAASASADAATSAAASAATSAAAASAAESAAASTLANAAKKTDVFETGLQPTFTNVLPLSQNAAGEVQNNLGYTYIIISGAGNETDAANWVSTGYIPVKQNDVLRFKDFGLPIGASSYCRILTYKADHTVASHGQVNTYDAANNSTGMNYIVSPSGGTNTVVLDDTGTNIVQLTICRPGTAAYVRFTVPASGVSSKSVITVNEEIAYEAGYGTKLNGNIQVDSSQIVGDLGQRSPWDILPGAHLAIAYSSIGRMAINTKEHFVDCCKNYGYNVLKCDVRPTSDGKLVLCHDAGFTLDTNGRITTYNAASSTSIHEMTAAQCIALEHADSKSYGLLGYYAKPCLIGDYLDVCRAYGKVAFVTIRDEYMDVVVPKLLEELRAHNMMYHTIINSMTYASLVKWRAADSIVCLNYTLSRSANITSTEIDQVIDLGNAMIGGFGFGAASNESDITCDFSYANEKKIRVMNAIGYVSGAYENCIAEGYDGLQIGYPWGVANSADAASGKADLAVPSAAGNLAKLTALGNLADSGLAVSVGSWTPTLNNVASYTLQNGYYAKIGGLTIVFFQVAGTFDTSTGSSLTISGCPVKPGNNYAAGGGYISGYHAADNVVFSGWKMNSSGEIIASGQLATTRENVRYAQTIYPRSGNTFEVAGTLAF